MRSPKSCDRPPELPPRIKICGLKRVEDVELALTHGADFLGFNFYPPSPRSLPTATAAKLAELARGRAERVAVLVDPSNQRLESLLDEVELDILQLHGNESVTRVAAIKAATGKRVMKVMRVAEPADLRDLPAYAAVADLIMFDAKPPKDPAALPGGNGLRFDWRLLEHLPIDQPWALAGGLDADNLADAFRLTGAPILDVSSGVETAPGIKDADRLRAFLRTAKSLGQAVAPGHRDTTMA